MGKKHAWDSIDAGITKGDAGYMLEGIREVLDLGPLDAETRRDLIDAIDKYFDAGA